MAYAIVTGEQGDDISAPDKIAAEPKHYCVYGIPEGGTNCSPARVGVREIETEYLPVFEAGIKKAGAYNAMASYNCIDGEAVIASEHYLREVLKERICESGFRCGEPSEDQSSYDNGLQRQYPAGGKCRPGCAGV